MKKKVLAALAAVSLLAACGSSGETGGSSGSGEVELNLWAGFTGADKLAMEPLVEKFSEENPGITVNFYSAPWNEMFTKFATAFGTDAGPDVLIMHATDIPNYATRDMLTPLDDLKSELGIDAADYAEAIWNGNAYEGTQWGIPLDFHPMAIYKNVAAFEAAGVDPDITFDSRETFLETARALTLTDDSGNVTQYGVSLGSDHAHSMRYWYGLLYQAGGQFLTDDAAQAAFNSDAGESALQFLADLVHVEGVAPYHEGDIDLDFISGTTAMVIEGPWFVPTLNEAGVEYTTATFPQIFDDQAVWAGSHTLTIPNYEISPERRDASYDLIKFIAENSILWAQSSGQIPAANSVVESAEYQALEDYDKWVPFIAEAEYVHYEPLVPKTAELGADNQLSPVLTAVLDAIRGESSAADALDTAAVSTDQILQD